MTGDSLFYKTLCKMDAQFWFALRPWRRHSLVLMVAGIIYICIGLSYIEAEPTVAREVALQVASIWMPLDKWGFVFLITGIVTAISSRWPPVSKTWGYFLLTGLSAAWSGFYAWAVVFLDSPWTNMSAVLIWGVIAFLWWAISGLVEPVVVIQDEH